MKAAIIEQYGSADVFRFCDVATPAPGDNHVLVRIRATVAHEYEQFVSTLAKWSKLTDARYQKTREQLVQRWEESSFRSETRALLAELRLQYRCLEQLHAQLA